MKKTILRVVLVIESTILLLFVAISCFIYAAKYNATELYRESSPDEKFYVLIQEIGKPDFPFGSDRLKVTLFEKRSEEYPSRPFYTASFTEDIPTDGTQADSRVEWLENGVQVVLLGVKKTEAYYILPFKTHE